MGSAGPAGPQTANAGFQADSLSKVREAVNLLNMAVAHLPVGSDEHKTVMRMIQDGAKIAPASAAIPGVQKTQLMGLAQEAEKTAMMQQLMRQAATQGGQAAPAVQPPMGA
jgi:hypothetical protein